jgi:hypothetical protein
VLHAGGGDPVRPALRAGHLLSRRPAGTAAHPCR